MPRQRAGPNQKAPTPSLKSLGVSQPLLAAKAHQAAHSLVPLGLRSVPRSRVLCFIGRLLLGTKPSAALVLSSLRIVHSRVLPSPKVLVMVLGSNVCVFGIDLRRAVGVFNSSAPSTPVPTPVIYQGSALELGVQSCSVMQMPSHPTLFGGR